MVDEKLRVKQGQKLNQASQDVGDPRNMAKILGVAGEGLWDFLGKAQEYLVPQSVEELALEGSPIGKAIGTGAAALKTAGVPFASYLAKKLLPRLGVFHGTDKVDALVAKGFDPTKTDPNDVMGWMHHAAENPAYASDYTTGKAEQLVWNDFRGDYTAKPSGIVPVHLEAQNVLDLVDPNMQDLETAQSLITDPAHYGLLNKTRQQGERLKQFIDKFNLAKDPEASLYGPNYSDEVPWGKSTDPYGVDAPSEWDVKARLANAVAPPPHWRHMKPQEYLEKIPELEIADALRLTPQEMLNGPFDAVRYNDMSEKSWAWPWTTQAKSAISGQSLTPKLTPAKESILRRVILEPNKRR